MMALTFGRYKLQPKQVPNMSNWWIQYRMDFRNSFRALSTNLRPYWNGRQQLSIDSSVALKGHQIIVPQAMRQSVLQALHKAHRGMTRTKNRARQVVYWPGLTKDIEEMIRKLYKLS